MFIHSFDDIPQNSKICIYGTGSRSIHFSKFINIFRKDIKIICFIDSFKKDGKIDDIKILNLNDFLILEKKYDFIVVASVFWKEVEEILNKRKINNFKILADSFAGFIYTEKNEKYSSKLPELLDIFKEDKHKKLYELIYKIRTGEEPIDKIIKYGLENMDNFKNHYLEFLIKEKIETFIDGGVFDGTSTNIILNELKNISNVFGFEPLKNKFNFNYSEFIDVEKYSNFEVYPKGLWHKSETLGFSFGGEGSAITKDENSQGKIETISLDEFVEKYNTPKIDFIKMDIENAELNALKGGIKTIKKDRPQLAISIYHSLEQFFEVPLFLKSNLENYSYYLGHYSCSKDETVLYAIPKELEKSSQE